LGATMPEEYTPEEGFLTDEEFRFWVVWELQERDAYYKAFFARIDETIAKAEALLAQEK